MRWGIALWVAVGLALAACGDDDQTPTDPDEGYGDCVPSCSNKRDGGSGPVCWRRYHDGTRPPRPCEPASVPLCTGAVVACDERFAPVCVDYDGNPVRPEATPTCVPR